MTGWQRVRLADVLTPVQRLETVADLAQVPFAGVRWYAEGVYPRVVEDAGTVKTKTLTRLEVDDVTYNRMWATKAAFGVVGDDSDGCLVTNDFPVFRALEDSLLPAYLGLVFKTTDFQAQASLLAVGTTERRRLKEPDFLKIEIGLPSVAEQRRIVDGMAALDAQVDALVAERLAAEVLAQRVADEIFSWAAAACELVALADVTSRVQNGVMYKRGAADGGWPVTRIQTISSGRVDLSKTGRAGFTDANAERFVLAPGDILFSNKNSLDRVGTTAMVRDADLPLVNGDNVLQMRASGIDARYLFAIMRSRQMRTAIRRVTRPAVNQASVNAGQVKALTVPITDHSDQARWGTAYVEALGQIEASETELDALRAFRSTLLTSLLNQFISIPESYDALLEQGTEVAS